MMPLLNFLSVTIFQLFCLFLNHVQAQNPVNYNTVYERAKKEYKQFEEKHGHYFQTRNVRMHYSTWGDPKGILLCGFTEQIQARLKYLILYRHLLKTITT